MAAVALAVAGKEGEDVVGVGFHLIAVAVVTIDEDEQVASLEVDFGAFVVAGGSAYPTERITIDGETLDVDESSANAFVGFTFTTDAKGEGIAYELGGIETADAVAVCHRSEVDEVNQCVYLVEGFALQDTSDEGFGSRTIA